MFGGFGGNQNNNNTPNITTRIRTMYGDTACMQLSYWNENFSIRINPMIGLNEQGIRQYDYNRRGSTALTPDKCVALATKIKELILPEIEKVKTTNKLEKPVNTGVSVGNKGSSFFVEYKIDDKGVPSLYATLYTNIGQDNVAPKDGVYSYKFTKTITVDNYDPESGTGTESINESEFMFFYEKLKGTIDITGTTTHASTLDNVLKRSRNNAQGTPQGGGGFIPSAPQPSGPPSFGQPPQNNYTAPMSTFNSEDLPF